ncbi:hypothetical protein BGW80DRAFT_1279222 [Lactifluus volemus]|nr:hypothetical protein BGW80DRAFT_1279222 [Lactifluus volemus]
MRLSALRWSVAGALEGEHAAKQARARSSGTFYQLKNNQWSEIQDMQATLQEIANKEEQIKLKLVVPELAA